MEKESNFTIFKKFIRYYVPHRVLLSLDLASALSNALLQILLPYLVFEIFNVYLPEKNLKYLILNSTLVAVIAAMMALCEFIGIKYGHVLGVRMERDMRFELFSHLQKLSFSYFDRTKTGHIMSRISNDLTQIAEIAHHGLEDLLIATVTLTGAFVVMFMINPLLTCLTLLPLPFIILWGSFFQKRMQDGFRVVRRKVAEINSQVENAIQGIREVKSFNNEKHEINRFDAVNNDFQLARENVFGVMATFYSGITFFTKSYSLLFVLGGAVLIYFDKGTLAEVIAFFMYSNYITMPILRMVAFTEQFQQGITAFERFREILLEKPDIEDIAHPVVPLQVNGEIEYRHVTFNYDGKSHSSKNILDDISLVIPAGKTIALVGESGAGKTTLAALLPRFYEPQAGEVLIDHNPVRNLKQVFLREQIGIVQQNPFLFDGTIRENILFGRPEATDKELFEAAKNANILDYIMTLPDKFDTLCGEHGVKLSGGQRQRISIARVFLKNPRILIFDEATSALDNESESYVQNSLQQLCNQRTTIIIAHRLSTVRHADYIYCLQKGKIVEHGTHDELMKLGRYYSKLYSFGSQTALG